MVVRTRLGNTKNIWHRRFFLQSWCGCVSTFWIHSMTLRFCKKLSQKKVTWRNFNHVPPACTQSSMHLIWQIDLANNPLTEMMWQMFTPQQNECHTLPERVDIFTTIEFFNYLSKSTPRLSPRFQSNIYRQRL